MTTEIQKMSSILLLVIILISSIHPAPVQNKDEVINITVEDIPESLLSTVNQHTATIMDNIAQKTAIFNKVVGQASENLSTGYKAVGDTVNTGVSAVSAAVSSGVEAVNSRLAPAIQSVNDGINFVSNGISSGVSSLGDTFSKQYTVGQNAISGGIKAVSDLASEGTALAQNTVTTLGKTVTNIVHQNSETVNDVVGQARGLLPMMNPFADRPRKLESAILEQEDVLSKTSSVKENLQQIIAGIFKPEPVVDTLISEDEKYGNNGDRFAGIGRAIVGTTEGIASFISNAVNVPFQVVKMISKTTQDKFNNLGAKLIGL